MAETGTAVAVQLDESESRVRRLTGGWGILIRMLAGGITLFHFLSLTVLAIDPFVFLGYSTHLFCIAVFLLFPMSPRAKAAGRVQPIDLVLIALSVAVMVYLGWNYQEIYGRIGFDPTPADVVFATVAIVLVLEMCRRVLGWFFPAMAIVCLVYALFGNVLPGIWGHRGYEYDRTVSLMFSTEGLYGFAMSAAATYIVLFVTFGAFMKFTGIGEVFVDIANAVTGRRRGGPAKASVVSSALFGMISGSSMGNVATIGTFTIPLMKRSGYSPAFAGAIEASASTGGQIMPPLMGSVAFVLAEATLTPYREVMLAAIIPAICFFAAIYFVVHFEAEKLNLRPLDRSEVPPLFDVLAKGWFLLLPVLLLIYLIVGQNRSVIQSATIAIGAALLVSAIRRRGLPSPRRIWRCLEEGTLGSIEAVAACAAAGVLIGVFTLTGFGNRFVDLALMYSSGSLLLCLVLVMLVTIILGFPLPTVPAYIITASVGAPLIVQLGGVEALAAHMFIMYFACVSTVTPPVALSAVAAAGIAGADPNRTSWLATRLCIAAYIIPFALIYNPALLWQGSWLDIGLALAMALLSAFAMALVTNSVHRIVVRVLAAASVPLLLAPRYDFNAAGVAAVAAVVILGRYLGPAARWAAAPSPPLPIRPET